MERLVLRLERLPDSKHHYMAERYFYPHETPFDECHNIRDWADNAVTEMSIELDKQEKKDRGFIGLF